MCLGRLLAPHTAGEKVNAGHRGRNRTHHRLHCEASDLVAIVFGEGGVESRQHHARLEQHALENDVVHVECAEDVREHLLRVIRSRLDAVVSWPERHLRLDHWHQPVLLADGGVTAEGLGVLGDGSLARHHTSLGLILSTARHLANRAPSA